MNKKRENKRDQGKVYSTQKRRKTAKKKNKASFPSDSEPEESHSGKENEVMEDNPPPLTESEWSESEDEDSEISINEESDSCTEDPGNIEIECNCCTLKMELPPELKASDQILINRESGEILIFPQDEIKAEENWIQECIIGNLNQDPSDNRVLYAKGDSQKLENFLKQEKEKTAQIIKEKCLEHSQKCETCEVLSRRAENRKESALIKEIWSNVEAEEVGDGKFYYQAHLQISS